MGAGAIVLFFSGVSVRRGVLVPASRAFGVGVVTVSLRPSAVRLMSCLFPCAATSPAPATEMAASSVSIPPLRGYSLFRRMVKILRRLMRSEGGGSTHSRVSSTVPIPGQGVVSVLSLAWAPLKERISSTASSFSSNDKYSRPREFCSLLLCLGCVQVPCAGGPGVGLEACSAVGSSSHGL